MVYDFLPIDSTHDRLYLSHVRVQREKNVTHLCKTIERHKGRIRLSAHFHSEKGCTLPISSKQHGITA